LDTLVEIIYDSVAAKQFITNEELKKQGKPAEKLLSKGDIRE
jgi:hypothetical protein